MIIGRNQLGNGLVSLSAKMPVNLEMRFCCQKIGWKSAKTCFVKRIFDLHGHVCNSKGTKSHDCI